jgi:hypothetical protein
MRSLWVKIPTSTGVIEGEIYSDRYADLARKHAGGWDAGPDATLTDVTALAELLVALGVPKEEYYALARDYWTRKLEPFWNYQPVSWREHIRRFASRLVRRS